MRRRLQHFRECSLIPLPPTSRFLGLSPLRVHHEPINHASPDVLSHCRHWY